MGVPVAQSMFAGASLVTTYLLSGQHTKSLLSPASLDSVARVVLVTTLQFLESLSDGKVRTFLDSAATVFILITAERGDLEH